MPVDIVTPNPAHKVFMDMDALAWQYLDVLDRADREIKVPMHSDPRASKALIAVALRQHIRPHIDKRGGMEDFIRSVGRMAAERYAKY